MLVAEFIRQEHLYLQELTRIPLDEKALAFTTHFKYLQDATKFFNRGKIITLLVNSELWPAKGYTLG